MFPIGIDLGTTYSAISKWENTKKRVGSSEYTLPNENRQTLPSKVFLERNDDGSIHFVVGSPAIRQGSRYPEFFIRDVKREMDKEKFAYELHGQSFTPIAISAEILKNLLQVVENIEGPNQFSPLGVVVTVPYYFKENQNRRTREAALKSLLDCFEDRCQKKQGASASNLFIGLLPEPIAAGLDYAFHQATNQNNAASLHGEKFLIFDLGGGTFDLTIFSLSQANNSIEFEVLSIDGDDRLGGEDFDNSFLYHIRTLLSVGDSQLHDKQKMKFEFDLKSNVTQAKIDLSQSREADFAMNFMGGEFIELKLKRQDFERCLTGELGHHRNYYDEIKSKIEAVLQKARLKASDITSVLMIGGSSKIPLFRQLVQGLFGESKIRNAENMDLAVARGAAIYAAYKLDEQSLARQGKREHLQLWDKIIIKERTAHSIGVEVTGRKFFMMIRDNELLPAKKIQFFNPDKLSEDKKLAFLDRIKVLQGTPSDFDVVGEVLIQQIYTHNRIAEDIPIQITFTADTSLIRVDVHVPKGNQDGSDYSTSETLNFSTSS